MSALARLEEFMEDLLEGSLAQLMRSPVQPAEIAKRLERAMELGQQVSVGKVLVPTHYTVLLHPDDFAALAPARGALEREMGRFIVEQAQERDFTLLTRPRISLQARAGVRRRRVKVEAQLADEGDEDTAELDWTPTELMATRAEAAPRARIHYQDAAGRPSQIWLDRPQIILGRARDSDVILDDPRVSRYHARILQRYNQFMLQDLGSTHGTQVNGESIQECILRSNDRISLGGMEILYEEI